MKAAKNDAEAAEEDSMPGTDVSESLRLLVGIRHHCMPFVGLCPCIQQNHWPFLQHN